MAQKRVLIVCGTGVATSTVVAKKVEEVLMKRGVSVKVEQCKASEAPSKAANFDLIVTTTHVSNVGNTPVIRSLSFISGIGMDKDIEKIMSVLGVS